MKTQPTPKTRRRSSQSGSAILLSLIILVMVAFGLAAWVSLLTSRTYFVETMENSIKRRIAHNNSVALAKEYMYRNALTKSSGSALHLELGDSMGGIDVPAWSGAACQVNSDNTYTQPTGSFTRLSPAEGLGYTKNLTITLSDGGESSERTYMMRSRSPILSGQLLTINQPWINNSNKAVSGNIRVEGTSVIWRPSDISTNLDYNRFFSNILLTPTVGASLVMKNNSGDDIFVSNFPMVPMTSGEFTDSGGNLQYGYDGKSSPVSNEQTPSNSLVQRAINLGAVNLNGDENREEKGGKSQTNGRITIELDEPTLSTVYIYNHVDDIYFMGQTSSSEETAAAVMDAVLVVFVQDNASSDEVDRVRFYGSNHRPLIFAMKVTDTTDDEVEFRFEDSDDDPLWRMMVISENTRIKFKHKGGSGTVTIKGGIQTDRALEMETGNNKILRIVREDNPTSLQEKLAGRQIWLENYHGDTLIANSSDPFDSYNAPFVGPGGTYDSGDTAGGDPGGGDPGGGDTGGGTTDNLAPSVVLSTSNASVTGSFEVTAAFSEDVSGVGLTDFLAVNANVSNLSGNGSTYSFTLTPIHLGPISVYAAQDTAADAAGNGNTASNSLNVIFAGPLPLFTSAFSSGTDGWNYQDDAFRSTNQPSYAVGTYAASGGQSGGGVKIVVGGQSGTIYGMSGAYTYTFNLDVESNVMINYNYKLEFPSPYEWDEYGEALLSIDGGLVFTGSNDYLLKYTGGSNTNYNSGWVYVEKSLGTLAAGTHTVRIGTYNNKKTYSDEMTTISIDNVSASATYP